MLLSQIHQERFEMSTRVEKFKTELALFEITPGGAEINHISPPMEKVSEGLFPFVSSVLASTPMRWMIS